LSRCDPNTWFEGDGLMTARRDIQPGEELTYDYCTSDTVLATRLRTCYCGTSLCRGTPLDSRLSMHFILPDSSLHPMINVQAVSRARSGRTRS
jgi:hypothetical protein